MDLKTTPKEEISCHCNPGQNLMDGKVIGIRVVAGTAILQNADVTLLSKYGYTHITGQCSTLFRKVPFHSGQHAMQRCRTDQNIEN